MLSASDSLPPRRPVLNSLLVADLCPTRTTLESTPLVPPDPADPGDSLAASRARTVRKAALQGFPHAEPLVGSDDDRVAGTVRRLLDPSVRAIQHAVVDLDGYRAEIPVLERTPTGQWRAFLISRRSGDDLSDEHLTAAGTLTALETAGVSVERLHVLHVNPAYRRPGPGAQSSRPPDPLDGPEHPPRVWDGLIQRTDVTAEARALQPTVETLRETAARVRQRPTIPPREIGAHCTKRGACRFATYCQVQEQRMGAAYPLRTLPRLRPKLKAALQHAGHHDAATIPVNFQGPKDPAFPKRKPAALREIQQTWARAYANGGWALDPDVVAAQFADASMPATFLDYETVKLVDGLIEGDKPNAEHAVRFSALTLTADGAVQGAGHVALGPTPEAELIPRVHAAVGETGTIFGYGSAEQTFTRGLIEKNPQYAELLEAQRARIQDQNAIWGKGMAHAALKGKTGAKNVAKSLGGPDDQYPADGIQNGTEVQALWLKARDPLTPPAERATLSRRIQAYNDHDTRVQLRIFSWQMGVARLASEPPAFVTQAVAALERAGVTVPDFRPALSPLHPSRQAASAARAPSADTQDLSPVTQHPALQAVLEATTPAGPTAPVDTLAAPQLPAFDGRPGATAGGTPGMR